MARNVVKADFSSAGGNRYITTKRRDQYNYGQILEIIGLSLPENFEVDFCNEEDPDTETVIGRFNLVDIPDRFFQTGRGILAYIYLHEGIDDGETEYRIYIPVGTRAERTEPDPTPEEANIITQAIVALNDGVERAEAAAQEIESMTAVAETLEPGSQATASWADGTLTIGVPEGLKGDQGDQGDPGVGIEDIVINADHTLTVVLTDGSTYTTEPIMGEKGDKGDKGDRGERGLRGVGIFQTFMNANYTLTLVYDDGSTYTTLPLRGEKGEKGDKGDKGDPGTDANLVNIVDGSAYSSVRGIGTTQEDANYTIGVGAFASGISTKASGFASHAEGAYNVHASGEQSHAEGTGTTASGANSHAEGAMTVSSGDQSHSEGASTAASGRASHAEGVSTIANHRSQHVFGEYNEADDSSAAATERGNHVEIVGNGQSSSQRSNARTLDWNGNEVLAGKLTMGANPTDNMDAATKGYVDTQIATAVSDIDGGLFTDWN